MFFAKITKIAGAAGIFLGTMALSLAALATALLVPQTQTAGEYAVRAALVLGACAMMLGFMPHALRSVFRSA